MRGRIGVDLDGTLAKSVKARNREAIGVPIRPMVQLVKVWLAPGEDVRLMACFPWMQPGCPGVPVESACRNNLSTQTVDEDAGCERQIIEDALAGSRGRVSGPDGAAARLGRSAGVADFGRIHVSRFLAWLSWLFIHIFSLIGFRNRLIVLIQWAWSYLTYERGARLITGDSHLLGWKESQAGSGNSGIDEGVGDYQRVGVQ